MSNKYKVLIIEDEKNIRKFVATLFDANNYQALTAKDVEEGKQVV